MFGVFPEGEVSTPPPPAAGHRMFALGQVVSLAQHRLPWSVLHEVRCPRRSRAGCRGEGRASDHWMARLDSPHYGGGVQPAL